MKVTLAALALSLTAGVTSRSVLNNYGQVPLGYQDDVNALVSLSDAEFEVAANDIATTLSASQRETLLLKLWEAHDVVEIMKMTGHGFGLDEMRTIQVFGEDGTRRVSEGDKLRLKKAGSQFMDVTEHPDLGMVNAQRADITSIAPIVTASEDAQEKIKAMTDVLDDTYLRADIEKLSSFWTRNYKSHWGLESSDWIYEHASELLKKFESPDNLVSVKKFGHKFTQNSIIARIESNTTEFKPEEKEIIVISAHQDSLNYLIPFYRAPGADDDGSGSVTVFQVLRSLTQAKFIVPSNLAIEFHWFAAEEGGLLGSQDVASAYEKAGKNIRGILHMDMTAYLKPGTEEIVGLFSTNVDKNLTDFTTGLVEQYLPIKWQLTECGSTCGSDHMSFTKAGYRAAFATEGLFSNSLPMTKIHTAGDSLDVEGYSFSHMLNFVKLGIAFIVELAAQ